MGGCTSRPPALDPADITRAASRGSWVTEPGPNKGHVSWRNQGPNVTSGMVLSTAQKASKSFRADIRGDQDHKHGVVEGFLSRIASRRGPADAPKGLLQSAIGKTAEGRATPPTTAPTDSRHKLQQDESLLEDLEAGVRSGVSGSHDSFEMARVEAVRELERQLSKRHGPAGQAWQDEEECDDDDIGEDEQGFVEHGCEDHVQEVDTVGSTMGLRHSKGGEQQGGRQTGGDSGGRRKPEGEQAAQRGEVQRLGGGGQQVGQELEVLGVTEPGEEQQQQEQRPHSRAAILRPRLMRESEEEEEREGRSAGSGGGRGVLMQSVACLPNSIFGEAGDDHGGGGGEVSRDASAAAAAGSRSGRAGHRHSDTSYLHTVQQEQREQGQGLGLAARGARSSDVGVSGHDLSRLMRAATGEEDDEEVDELMGRGSRGAVRAPAPPMRHNLMAAPLMQQLRQQAEAEAAAQPRQQLDYTPSPGAAARAKSALRGQPSRGNLLCPAPPQQQDNDSQARDCRARLDYMPTKSITRRGINGLAGATASSTSASPPCAFPSAPSRAGSNVSTNSSHCARSATATTLNSTSTASSAYCQSTADHMPSGILSARASTGQVAFVSDRLHSGTHAALLPTSASCSGFVSPAKAPHKQALTSRGNVDCGIGPRVGFTALASPVSPRAASAVVSPRLTALAAASSRAPSRPSSPRGIAGSDGGGGSGGGGRGSSSDGGAAGGAAAALTQLLEQQQQHPELGPTGRAEQQPSVAFAAAGSRGGGGSGRGSGGGGDVVGGEKERPQQGTLGHASLARDRATRLLATMARLRGEGG